MLASYHAAPKKPEKSTKTDHGQGQRGSKDIANSQKERGKAEKPSKPKPE